MHKSYQPLHPTTNRFLQHRWDRSIYEDHRSKVKQAKPVVDTKGAQTPAHVRLKLKKVQAEEERQYIVDRDNHLLASRLSSIGRSKGLVDHRNHYVVNSLNAERRRQELQQVTQENLGIYQRLVARKSEYRREVWKEAWEKSERRRDDVARYPRGASNVQASKKSVKFSAETSGEDQKSSSDEDDQEKTEDKMFQHAN